MEENKQTNNITEKVAQPQGPPDSVQGVDVYPLRAPSEDPRWALRTVWTWVSIAVFLLVFIVALLILGIWFD